MMVAIGFALVVALLAAGHDLRTRTLPDWLTLGAAALGLPVHVASQALAGARGMELVSAAVESGLGGLLAVLPPALLVARGVLGRGDLKLFLALGTILGPGAALTSELYGLVFAALLVPFFTWRSGRLGVTLAGAWSLVRRQKADRSGMTEWMPFAPAILLGVIAAAVTG